MRPIGFSTGALAKGDLRRGLDLQRRSDVSAVELSALRDHELPLVMEALDDVRTDSFSYVSVHAPSKLRELSEDTAFAMLYDLPAEWPIVVHPDVIQTKQLWSKLGDRLCLENMDIRKSTGRTVEELRGLFEAFPRAGFCLDLGHAKQIDPTMGSTLLMLREFGPRLRQVHVSDVGPRGEHRALGVLAVLAFSVVANHIPATCPIIIESVIAPDRMDDELAAVRLVLEPRSAASRDLLKEWRACWERRTA
jgi:hypothetical protein